MNLNKGCIEIKLHLLLLFFLLLMNLNKGCIEIGLEAGLAIEIFLDEP